mmetsp:Transcript_8821/g.29186  ORF Transcript_8821/g.29186 Transcript_8821/m.29186 type:complete len:217 (-) Transcript_8821:7-657(-)
MRELEGRGDACDLFEVRRQHRLVGEVGARAWEVVDPLVRLELFHLLEEHAEGVVVGPHHVPLPLHRAILVGLPLHGNLDVSVRSKRGGDDFERVAQHGAPRRPPVGDVWECHAGGRGQGSDPNRGHPVRHLEGHVPGHAHRPRRHALSVPRDVREALWALARQVEYPLKEHRKKAPHEKVAAREAAGLPLLLAHRALHRLPRDARDVLLRHRGGLA